MHILVPFEISLRKPVPGLAPPSQAIGQRALASTLHGVRTLFAKYLNCLQATACYFSLKTIVYGIEKEEKKKRRRKVLTIRIATNMI